MLHHIKIKSLRKECTHCSFYSIFNLLFYNYKRTPISMIGPPKVSYVETSSEEDDPREEQNRAIDPE
jgi:hypothetical protein